MSYSIKNISMDEWKKNDRRNTYDIFLVDGCVYYNHNMALFKKINNKVYINVNCFDKITNPTLFEVLANECPDLEIDFATFDENLEITKSGYDVFEGRVDYFVNQMKNFKYRLKLRKFRFLENTYYQNFYTSLYDHVTFFYFLYDKKQKTIYFVKNNDDERNLIGLNFPHKTNLNDIIKNDEILFKSYCSTKKDAEVFITTFYRFLCGESTYDFLQNYLKVFKDYKFIEYFLKQVSLNIEFLNAEKKVDKKYVVHRYTK